MTTAMRGAHHATATTVSAAPAWNEYGKRADPSGYRGEQSEQNSPGPEAFAEKFAELAGALAPVFSRRDLRANAIAYVHGLLMPGDVDTCLAWSAWRRRHQARARWHHHHRRYALIA
jgi:hypothetical protein